MARKLSEEKINEILETATAVFADMGYDRANTNVIAHRAGISVGVLFKYYRDKEGLFLACLRRSLDVLEGVLAEVEGSDDNAFGKAESLFRTVIAFSRNHADHIRMYHMITAGNNKQLTAKLADEIESVSARVYGAYIAKAQQAGEIRSDISPEKAAFFFDNLLMMLQFTYSCDYYKRRLEKYTGVSADDEQADEEMIRQLLLFMDSALGSKN